MPEARRGKRAPRRQRAPVRTSREEIQEKAVQLFLKKGYHGTSTTDICDAVGISRPTLYWYFKDKEDILFSLHKQRIEKSFQPITASAKAEPDPVLRLKRFMADLTGLICTEPESKILIKETEYLDPEHQEWVVANWKEQFDMLRATISELKAAGKARDVSETFMAFSLLGMITWAYNWFDYARPEGIGRLAANIQDVFLTGLLKSES
ncbi:MAG: TetR/AcrR family transcriptional regulator [Deltaproteobacteria bacterium]|nr:TetR/AcrR family transcriptional regulator [Deltaproteobacteria bacterium]